VRAAAKPGDAPLGDAELDSLFAPLAGVRHIALAVSGGADSLALLDAVDRWRGDRTVTVLTVDHRLRKGSRAEALGVAKIAAERGLASRVLTWRGVRPISDIEAKARAARYRLLLDACREIGATHLVVAHQRDDVAETFLMRLKRGAGVFGLAAMRPVLDAGGVMLVRPFLAVPRARLSATVRHAGLTPVADPMNDDPRYERVRMRRLLAAGHLDAAAIAATAMRMAEAADAIDAAATALLGEVDSGGVAWLEGRAFAAAPVEVRTRALTRLLLAIGGDAYPPHRDKVAGLAAAMLAGGKFKRTLAGVVVASRDGRFAFAREAGRTGLPTVSIKPGTSVTWDRRYLVTVTNAAPRDLAVGPGSAMQPVLLRRGKALDPQRLPKWATIRPILAERLSRPPLFPDFAGER
jgi:tRNA(Ile)-lysidine synthase